MKCYGTKKYTPITIEVETQNELNALLRMAQNYQVFKQYLACIPVSLHFPKEEEAVVDFLISALLGFETYDD